MQYWYYYHMPYVYVDRFLNVRVNFRSHPQINMQHAKTEDGWWKNAEPKQYLNSASCAWQQGNSKPAMPEWQTNKERKKSRKKKKNITRCTNSRKVYNGKVHHFAHLMQACGWNWTVYAPVSIHQNCDALNRDRQMQYWDLLPIYMLLSMVHAFFFTHIDENTILFKMRRETPRNMHHQQTNNIGAKWRERESFENWKELCRKQKKKKTMYMFFFSHLTGATIDCFGRFFGTAFAIFHTPWRSIYGIFKLYAVYLWIHLICMHVGTTIVIGNGNTLY